MEGQGWCKKEVDLLVLGAVYGLEEGMSDIGTYWYILVQSCLVLSITVYELAKVNVHKEFHVFLIGQKLKYGVELCGDCVAEDSTV